MEENVRISGTNKQRASYVNDDDVFSNEMEMFFCISQQHKVIKETKNERAECRTCEQCERWNEMKGKSRNHNNDESFLVHFTLVAWLLTGTIASIVESTIIIEHCMCHELGANCFSHHFVLVCSSIHEASSFTGFCCSDGRPLCRTFLMWTNPNSTHTAVVVFEWKKQ